MNEVISQSEELREMSNQETEEEADWDCISGKYFRDGEHVKLDERPPSKINSAIEQRLRNERGIYDVNVTSIVMVYADSSLGVGRLLDMLEDVDDLRFKRTETIDKEHDRLVTPGETDKVHVFDFWRDNR